MKKYELRYKKEAPFGNEDFSIYNHGNDILDDGWEKWSLPLGNGYMGVNIFGRVKEERMQITENSLCNPYSKGNGGLNNFCDIYLDFEHENVENYKRGLCLNNAVAYTEYDCNGVHFKREHFASYPDKVFVTKLSCNKPGGLSFVLRPEIPYVKPYLFEEGDGMGKTAKVSVSGDTITIGGEMEYYRIKYEGIIYVHTEGGELISKEKTMNSVLLRLIVRTISVHCVAVKPVSGLSSASMTRRWISTRISSKVIRRKNRCHSISSRIVNCLYRMYRLQCVIIMKELIWI